MESHARRLALLGWSRSLEREPQGDHFRHAANGQRSVHRPSIAAAPDAATAISQSWEVVHVAEVGTSKVIVTNRVLRADAGSVDRDVESAVCEVPGHRD